MKLNHKLLILLHQEEFNLLIKQKEHSRET